jgi:hypothetical protein
MSAASAGLLRSSGPTLALVAASSLCLAHPDRALQLLERVFRSLGERPSEGRQLSPSITVRTLEGNSGHDASSLYAFMVQLGLGAGLCWGSYALWACCLPQSLQGMLPVSQFTFRQAGAALGRSILQAQSALAADLQHLWQGQQRMAVQADETYHQVVGVQDQLERLDIDIDPLEDSLETFRSSLEVRERRTAHMVRGIRLMTQGVTTLLPPDHAFVRELEAFWQTSLDRSSLCMPDKREGKDRTTKNRCNNSPKATGRRHRGSSRPRERSGGSSPQSPGGPLRESNHSKRSNRTDQSLLGRHSFASDDSLSSSPLKPRGHHSSSNLEDPKELGEVRQLLETMAEKFPSPLNPFLGADDDESVEITFLSRR